MLEDRSCQWNPLFERISVGSRETWGLGWAGREPRQIEAEESLAQEGVREGDRRSRFFYAKQVRLVGYVANRTWEERMEMLT
jgi:hypothetical protein